MTKSFQFAQTAASFAAALLVSTMFLAAATGTGPVGGHQVAATQIA